MSIPTTATPPLLLTKRLNAFLHAHQTAHLPTLLLTTTHGKLLAHASSLPVSVLRTHATVAASLLAIHTSSSVAIPTALPGSRTPEPISSSPPISERDDDDDDDHGYDHDEEDDRARAAAAAERASQQRRNTIKPVTITVQLSDGTVIIRRLKCGLLFVCVGPSAATHNAQDLLLPLHPTHHHENGDTLGVGSPSEVESLMSTGAQTTSSLESASHAPVVAMRRHAAELARWLDEKLGTLKVPEEGIGVVE